MKAGRPMKTTYKLQNAGMSSGKLGIRIRKRATWLFGSLAALICASGARAQNYKIDSFTIATGGSDSSGGKYSVSETISPTTVGKMSGASYTVEGGLRSVVQAIQTEGAPTLSISAGTGLQATLSWSATATGFTLQQNSNLAQLNGWNGISPTITVANGTNYATITSAPVYNFYRLKK